MLLIWALERFAQQKSIRGQRRQSRKALLGLGLSLSGGRWAAHPLGIALHRDQTWSPALVPAPQKWQLSFGLVVSNYSYFAPAAQVCSYF